MAPTKSVPILFGFVLALCLPLHDLAAQAPEETQSRHVGYYYPKPTEETYVARATILPEADRAFRVGFVTGITGQMSRRAYAPHYVIFAKGTHAQKLIITAITDGPMDTLYRGRAVLAELTAMARTLPVFREFGVEDWFTFLDLCKMMGFSQVTITDGRDFAHQFKIE